MDARRITVNGEVREYWDQLFWAGLTCVAFLPATVAPAASTGLPIGVQIVGPEGGDYTTIELARQLATPYRGIPPPARLRLTPAHPAAPGGKGRWVRRQGWRKVWGSRGSDAESARRHGDRGVPAAEEDERIAFRLVGEIDHLAHVDDVVAALVAGGHPAFEGGDGPVEDGAVCVPPAATRPPLHLSTSLVAKRPERAS